MQETWDRKARENIYHWVYCLAKPEPKSFYEEGASQAVFLLRPALERLQFTPRDKRILDIGCGPGRFFPGFVKLGFAEIWGIDVSPEMIRQGTSMCPVSTARFVLGNGHDLAGLKSETFDYCFSYNAFAHIPSRRIIFSYLKEIYRVLKPNGVFQLHFRSSHEWKDVALHALPSVVRPFVLTCYRVGTLCWLQGESIKPSMSRTFKLSDFWYGVAYSPSEVVRQLTEQGFVDVETDEDPSITGDGRRFWVLGRKPAVSQRRPSIS
jgi:SAM-dependent methyltransferase